MTTLMQILGWIEHCEREHPRQGTVIPTWLCTWEAFQEAVEAGWIEKKSEQAFIPRWGMSQVIYGLSEKGRVKFYTNLPKAGHIEQRQ